MQSQGSGLPESRYGMSYSHSALTGDGVDLYGHGPDPYVLQHQHHIVGHGGPPGMSPTGHIGMGSPGQQHHQHSSKRSADVAGLNLKQDPMVSDVTMSTIGMGHSTMDDGGSGSGGQNGSQTKKTPPPNGKKTKGRVKIKMEFIDNKLRRYTTFSKRKTGIMKKAYELSTLTGTQVMLLVASETGHVYTFATRKLQPMITSEAGKQLIQTCLNSPDPPSSTVDQRMSATGFEETELTYTLHDEDQKDSESDDGDDAASSDAASRSPSPADLERSSYSPDAPVALTEQPMMGRAGGTHTTTTTTHSGHHQLTAGNSNQLSSRILNHPSGSTTRGSAGGGGGAGRGTSITEPSVGHQTASYANGPRHATSSSCATTTTTSSSSSSVTTNHHATNSSGGGGKNTTAVVSAPALVSCPVNLTPSQLASLAANLPALSGLSLPHLPRGTNFASLLASASSLLTGVGAVGGVLTGGGGGPGGLATSSGKSPASAAETSVSRKHLPRLISLAHVGAALQQQSNSAKDASIKSTTSLMAADQRSDSAQTAGPGGGSSSSHPALNLQTATTTSTTTTLTANRDKRGGSSKSRAGAKKNKK
ncbi:serum response factor homolog isoform X2 [Daphnia pulex]|uniref:serum response factor homolog isoform X2 n=1 Tax=Daphnia pulex TaxID=6669 RepID=UPI001EDD3633|nr:serum response factor homolog isoform X2 [Daphnia pulex]